MEAADAQLFRARPYILCPSGTRPLAFEVEFRDWLTKMGASVLEMPAEEHDATVALTSHLPQLLSTALADTLAAHDNPQLSSVFGGGLLDMTRLALSSPDLWLSILETNRLPVEEALDGFIRTLIPIREAIGRADLRDYFARASEYSSELRKLPLKS